MSDPMSAASGPATTPAVCECEGRIGDIESALRQIMDETKVSRSKNGQPVYIGAYRHGLAEFVRQVVAAEDRNGWQHRLVSTLQVGMALACIAYLVKLFR